ncbi:MAG TPA: MFS transporter [Thermoplasmata archaeon]|nr:MFS transporter [Thermoplasmata archaeon]
MAEPAGERPSYRRVLANRSFSFLWLGQLVSQSGDFIFDVALLWLVLDLTGSAFYTGVTVAVELLPTVIVAPLAGVFVDRFDRKKLLEATIALQGVTVGLLALLLVAHLLTLGAILVLVFLLNAAAQFPRATVPALLPRLVASDDLMAANSLYSFSTSSNQLVSLSLGGLVVAVFGIAFPLYYDAATFFVAVLLVAFVSAAYTRAPVTPEGPPSSLGRDLVEGWRFVRSDRVLSELLLLGLTLNIFGGILLALLAPYAKLSLGGSAATYGFLLASLAAGSIVGAAVLGAVNIRRHVGRLLFVGIAGIGASIGALGVFPIAALAIPITGALGVALIVANLPLGALFQVRVPDHLRGRSNGMMMAVLTAPQPIGALLAGAFSRLLSLNGVLAVSGLLVLGITGIFLATLPHLRRAAY